MCAKTSLQHIHLVANKKIWFSHFVVVVVHWLHFRIDTAQSAVHWSMICTILPAYHFCAKSQKDVHISLVPCTHKLAHILTNYPAVQHKCIIGLYCAAHILCMCNAVHAQHCLMPYIVHHISLVCNNA